MLLYGLPDINYDITTSLRYDILLILLLEIKDMGDFWNNSDFYLQIEYKAV